MGRALGLVLRPLDVALCGHWDDAEAQPSKQGCRARGSPPEMTWIKRGDVFGAIVFPGGGVQDWQVSPCYWRSIMATHYSNLTRAGVMALGVLAAFAGSGTAAPLSGPPDGQASNPLLASDGQAVVIQVQNQQGGPYQGGPYRVYRGGGINGTYGLRPPSGQARRHAVGRAMPRRLCWMGGHDDGTGRGMYMPC